MPGIARTLTIPPNAQLPSQIFSIVWTTARFVVDPNERFGGIVSNLLIQNRDPTNAITVRINHGPAFTIGPNLSIPFNEQWIDLIDITPNAGTGDGNLVGQFVPNSNLR